MEWEVHYRRAFGCIEIFWKETLARWRDMQACCYAQQARIESSVANDVMSASCQIWSQCRLVACTAWGHTWVAPHPIMVSFTWLRGPLHGMVLRVFSYFYSITVTLYTSQAIPPPRVSDVTPHSTLTSLPCIKGMSRNSTFSSLGKHLRTFWSTSANVPLESVSPICRLNLSSTGYMLWFVPEVRKCIQYRLYFWRSDLSGVLIRLSKGNIQMRYILPAV